MRTLIIISFFLICSGSLREVSAQENEKLKAVLNELKVELVQPGTISTGGFEFGTSISPDRSQLFFVKGITGFRRTVIVYCDWNDGYWSKPKVAPFSGQYPDTNPYFSKDGNRLYFTSTRPTQNPSYGNSNIWYVDRIENEWSKPRLLEGGINDKYEIVYPTMDSEGTIHFVSWSRPESKNGDIFMSTLHKGKYSVPILVDELNTLYSDADPEISPDGKFLILTSQREGGYGHYDLYIFKRQVNGKWGAGINLGPKVNSVSMDSDPIFDPRGNVLYFSSDRLNSDEQSIKYSDYDELVDSYNQIHNGLMNIYKVNITSLIDYLD
ncbi:MAG: hypothetical protein RLO81_19550 [Fulvivirga sp.]|uniref:hypothetical protein n=1 Tax=Fulvivirga sp. TaxID=1931237 RepID=UPI0032EF99A7